jgi:hypothetical protein
MDRLDDALNPVLVKELRQAVRSRFVAALLFLFLFAQLAIVALVLTGGAQSGIRPGLGRELFMALHGAILFACMIGLPVYTAVRLFGERGLEGLDLLYVTALTPRAITTGKMMAGFILALLLYSASLPFVTFTYLLRGIALEDIFLTLALGLLAVLTGLAFALAAAALGGGRVLRVLVGLMAFGTLVFGYGMVEVILLMLMEEGGMLRELELLATLTVFCLVCTGWMFGIATAMLAPPSAERARGLRLYGVIMMGISAGVAVLGGGGSDIWQVWMIGWGIVAALGFAIATSGPEQPSPRVRKKIPRSLVGRFLAFPFTSGAAGGMLWAAGILAGSLLGTALLGRAFGSRARLGGAMEELGTFVLYCAAYALTAVLLRRTLLRRRVPPERTWVVLVLLLALGGAVIPVLALVLAPLMFSVDGGFWLITSPFAMTQSTIDEVAPLVAAGWTLVALVANGRWFLAQWRAFRPAPEETP